MTTDLATSSAESWLTPRDTYLLLALTSPPPAEIRRDLANILRAAAAYAHPWRPIPAPTDAGSTASGPGPLASAAATPSQRTPSPTSGKSWFRRGPLRARTGF